MANYTFGGNWVAGDPQAGVQAVLEVRGERGDVVPYGADGLVYIIGERDKDNMALCRLLPSPVIVELEVTGIAVGGAVHGHITNDTVTYDDVPASGYPVGVVVELVGRAAGTGKSFVYIG